MFYEFLIVVFTFSSGADCFNLHHNSSEAVSLLCQGGQPQSPGFVVRMKFFNGVERGRPAPLSADRNYFGRSSHSDCCEVEPSSWRFHFSAVGDCPRCQVENFRTLEVVTVTVTSCDHHLVVVDQCATWFVCPSGLQPRPLVGILPP